MKPHAGMRRASGRFVLRIEPSLRLRLRREVLQAEVSLNEWCAKKLTDSAASFSAKEGAGSAVHRATEVCGDSLVAVAVFGSWARGEAADGSDVDLMVVVEDTLPLTRALYATWDEAPLQIEGHPVEPQFVHLPAPSEIAAGFWADVAIDGIVLYERRLRLSQRLVKIRNDIAARRIERRSSHGQSYWVRNEVA